MLLCLVPAFSGNALGFSSFNLLLTIALLYIALITFGYMICITDVPLTSRGAGIAQRLSQYLVRYSSFFFLQFVYTDGFL